MTTQRETTQRCRLSSWGVWRACLLLLAFCLADSARAQLAAWPAESEEQALNLSGLNEEFGKDLSGAVWNPSSRTLWVCRNGPGKDSRLWVLEEDSAGTLRIATDGEQRGEWRGLGDVEGVTFADWDEAAVYLIVEGAEEIHELDVSTYGEARIRQVYDASAYLPRDGSAGAEAITFVPDEFLSRGGFVDADANPYVSRHGMGGLMLVGHQNGGGIFAFDLDRTSGAVHFVGEYRITASEELNPNPHSEIVGLEFDRSSGLLFAWQRLDGSNSLCVLELASHTVAGAGFRGLEGAGAYQGPSDRQIEGLALAPVEDCGPQGRALFLTVDDGKSHALFRHENFVLGCAGLLPAGDEAEPEPEPPAPHSSSADIWGMLFSVVGGLGIFLIGMKYLSDGMQAIAGSRLRKMINAVTDNRFLAVAVGTGMTCLVQSSSITTVIVVGFVNSGLMQLRQAIGVIMGANIGTTITGWILVLKVGKYGLPLLGASALVYLFTKRDRWRYIAMACMGLGMVFFGLELMKDGVKPMRSVPEFQAAFAWFVADSYLGVLKCAAAGCILTLMVQSSSATLGITISLAVTGTIPFETAAALVLGENVGTTITAWLAAIGTSINAKRAAYAHVGFNLIGVFWITLIFGYYIRLIGKIVYWQLGVDVLAADFVPEKPGLAFGTTMSFAIATVHTVFNVTNTVLFIGFLRPYSRFLERMIPDRGGKQSLVLSLGSPLVASPTFALQESQAAIVSAAVDVQNMLDWTRELLLSAKPEDALSDRVFRCEERLDDVEAEVIEFLTNLLMAATPHDIAIEARQQLRIVDEYESVSDYISAILKARLRLEDHGLSLPEKHRAGLLALHDEVAHYVKLVSEDYKGPEVASLARARVDGKSINRRVKELRNAQLQSLSEEHMDPILSMSYSTMLNSYRKVKDHALNIAESMALN